MNPRHDEPVLIDTHAAAEALRTSARQLNQWADDGVVTPAATDPDGQRRWNLHDLRRQLAAHVDQRSEN
jgi:DNA-binding transcriptional MerR regulator